MKWLNPKKRAMTLGDVRINHLDKPSAQRNDENSEEEDLSERLAQMGTKEKSNGGQSSQSQ